MIVTMEIRISEILRKRVDQLTEEEKKILRKWYLSHHGRGAKIDLRRTAKHVPVYVKTWYRRPNRYDIPGVDTPENTYDIIHIVSRHGYIRIRRGQGSQALPQWIREKGNKGLASEIWFVLTHGKETMTIIAYTDKTTRNYVVLDIKPLNPRKTPEKYLERIRDELIKILEQEGISVEKGKYGYAILIPKNRIPEKYLRAATRIYSRIVEKTPLLHIRSSLMRNKDQLIRRYAVMIILDRIVHRLAEKYGIKIMGE